ncbi:MAG: hypothetical protein ACM3XM_17300 [Mycobacterium leprae]
MVILGQLFVMLLPLLVAFYTFNYGRYVWRQRNRGGAVGLYLLAATTVLVPGVYLFWR